MNNELIVPFINKLYNMISDSIVNQSCVSWSEDGKSFIINDKMSLEQLVLPMYFKHGNMMSFIRQLNFYNFSKVQRIDSVLEYKHINFQRDQYDLLKLITRKNSNDVKSVSNCNLKNVIDQLQMQNAMIFQQLNLMVHNNMILQEKLHNQENINMILQEKVHNQENMINQILAVLNSK